MGAHFEALDDGVLLVLLDPRYTQVGFNIVSVQVCHTVMVFLSNLLISIKGRFFTTTPFEICEKLILSRNLVKFGSPEHHNTQLFP